jgi:hypothetical protein
MTYQEQLKHPKWQKKRLEILNRDNWMCQKCKEEDLTLHIHHKNYEKDKKAWEYPDSNFITLCESCHNIISNSEYNGKKLQLNDFEIINFGDAKIVVIEENNSLTLGIYDPEVKYHSYYSIAGLKYFTLLRKIINRLIKNGKEIH